MHHLYPVVFASRIDYNRNRSDSDVSRSEIICLNSPEHWHEVRYSFILHARCSLSHPSGPESSNPAKGNRVASSTTKNSPVHIPSNRLEVKVHRAYEEYPMAQMNRCGSYPSSDTQLADKPLQELVLEDNVTVDIHDEKK
jgi:hypothetical protein